MKTPPRTSTLNSHSMSLMCQYNEGHKQEPGAGKNTLARLLSSSSFDLFIPFIGSRLCPLLPFVLRRSMATCSIPLLLHSTVIFASFFYFSRWEHLRDSDKLTTSICYRQGVAHKQSNNSNKRCKPQEGKCSGCGSQIPFPLCIDIFLFLTHVCSSLTGEEEGPFPFPSHPPFFFSFFSFLSLSLSCPPSFVVDVFVFVLHRKVTKQQKHTLHNIKRAPVAQG